MRKSVPEQQMANHAADTVLTTVRQQLEQLILQLDSVPDNHTRRRVANRMVRYSLQTVLAVIDQMQQHVGEGEADEEAAVYSILAEHLARELGLPEEVVFRAVIDLCAGPDPHALTTGLPPADPRITTDLRGSIVQIMVRYEAPKTGSVTRTVKLLYGGDQRGVKERQVQSEISRDDLPADVRERFLRESDREATFQLYPRRT
ncbi:MAG: hypothetical protein JO266_09945 [Acidobacteria bacterium]|nr:hypothetical protein [Acidobacteriota bacterium]